MRITKLSPRTVTAAAAPAHHWLAAKAALALAAGLVAGVVSTQPAHAQANFKVLHTFKGAAAGDGSYPAGSLVQDVGGNLYGTTAFGGDPACGNQFGCGTVFKVDLAGNEALLYSFLGQPMDGAGPSAGLVQDATGNLYGTTSAGGEGASSVYGTLFTVDSSGKETMMHSFIGHPTDGAQPVAGLVGDSAGNLYGATATGGDLTYCYPYGCGTVFKLDTTGQETVLYNFTGGADGASPFGGLVRDAAGDLYGTTYYGGSGNGPAGHGTVFKLDSTGRETVLYTFTGGADGASPYAGVLRDAIGNLYGTTYYGGSATGYSGYGTVFKLDPTGKETVLYSFTGGADGAHPWAGLVRDAAGNLYGASGFGGSGTGTAGYGTLFKVDSTGNENVLYTFTGGADGACPVAALTRDAAGNLFGTTNGGGDATCACGTVFVLAR